MSTYAAGQILTAANLEDLLAPGWTSYTPVWTSSGSAPSIGNGTRAGQYRRSTGGDLIIVRGRWIAGSTTTFGTGFYSFSLPVNASSSSQSYSMGVCQLLDFGTIRRCGTVFCNTASTIGPVSDAGDVTNTVPYTWANGDSIVWQIAYEPA